MAIRAYLDTVTPVRNPVVANQLPFPFDIRAAMRGWDALYFTPANSSRIRAKSAQWNRGAYPGRTGPAIAAPATRRRIFSAPTRRRQALQGIPVQGWFAPDITGDTTRGLGTWSVDDIVAYLKTGHNRITTATGPMGEEVADASSHFTDDDLKAIATYLKSLPGGGAKPAPLAPSDPRMAAGKAIYRDVCSACHALDGNGVPNLFPALAKAPQVAPRIRPRLIRVVLRGARSVATAAEPTAPGMPSFAWQLDDAQVAAVLTYIRNGWGAAAPAVSAEDVRKQRADLANRSD